MTLHENAYNSLPKIIQADFKPMDELTEEEKAAWISSVVLDRKGEERDEFFEYTWSRLNHLLFNIHINTELVVENMQTFGAEGVRYLELMTFYDLWRDENNALLPADRAKAIWQNRLAQPDAMATGVKVRFKAAILRFADDAIEVTRRHFAYVHNNRDLWVGIDMAGREDDNRGFPSRFTESSTQCCANTQKSPFPSMREKRKNRITTSSILSAWEQAGSAMASTSSKIPRPSNPCVMGASSSRSTLLATTFSAMSQIPASIPFPSISARAFPAA